MRELLRSGGIISAGGSAVIIGSSTGSEMEGSVLGCSIDSGILESSLLFSTLDCDPPWGAKCLNDTVVSLPLL